MKKLCIVTFLCLTLYLNVFAQKGIENKSALTVTEIMNNSNWFERKPSDLFWSLDNNTLYFNWEKPYSAEKEIYQYSLINKTKDKVIDEQTNQLPNRSLKFNKAKTKAVFEKHGDIFLQDLTSGNVTRITSTLDDESHPKFSFKENAILFQKKNNLFAWDIKNGTFKQLTNFTSGFSRSGSSNKYSSDQEKWLNKDQLSNFEVLNRRNKNKKIKESETEKFKYKFPKEFSLDGSYVTGIELSPDEKHVVFTVFRHNDSGKGTIVPDFVTESGYTENLQTRKKVGSSEVWTEMKIYNIEKDTVYDLKMEDIPGIYDIPAYYADYNRKNDSTLRKCIVFAPKWDTSGKYAVIQAKATDNKDRWFLNLSLEDGSLELLDRQHDEAWVGGPGIASWNFVDGNWGWMPNDSKHIWFQSEETGYSHLYTLNTKTKKKKALTNGNFEIREAWISNDNKSWYLVTNQEHPGTRHLYRMPLKGGKTMKITTMEGNNEICMSYDEKTIAIRHSWMNKPWEIYVMENKANAAPQQITSSTTDNFKEYSWREPEVITFKAKDEADIYARLYKPATEIKNNKAVIFVHGAGYLQNAHKWWSNYYREYMFHNLLADNGYTVLDIDYRGSDGYGRDCRTGIYRNMGGKDLEDHVDGAKYLIEKYGIDADKIGIYGGSYGGFITLMAMFKYPDVFKAGAALRSVTDWAHYNHGYTSNILNTPTLDSIAYQKSSPIYYADGLKGDLLICHGMVDINVHFQDVVRLAQRLIELGKDNWELAVYPMEDHSFVEPESWADEYKRIFKLFQTKLK